MYVIIAWDSVNKFSEWNTKSSSLEILLQSQSEDFKECETIQLEMYYIGS